MNKLRLKWKIFAFLLGFCALLLVILWLFQTVFLHDMYKYIRTQELRRVIATVEREINSPDFFMILHDIQIENDVIVTLTQDFITPPRPMIEIRTRRSAPAFDAVTETREFTLANGQRISLTFYAIISPVNAAVSTLQTQLYIITGVMVVLSVLLAIVIAKRISKPIEDISRSAQTLAKGNYNTRFSGEGFYEIVELSETLNTTATELGKVEGLRRDLMANVSHDLRTPLALIYSYAEMMNDFPDEITPEQTKLIMDETRWLTALVNDVLDISKLESDVDALNHTRFNLTQNILGTTGRMMAMLKNDGYEIDFAYDSEAYLYADETKISRVFYNLLINAVNFCGDSRRITVGQYVSGENVRISVTDYGTGIAAEDLPFIWDRYYKNGKNHKRAASGTGLGLSIAKKIIEKHGGSCGVTTEIGKGSTFWFELRIS